MAMLLLEKAMQVHVLNFAGTRYAIAPDDALKFVKRGLADAAKLAEELSPRNFVPDEIRRQQQNGE
jgi:hypothetical protein